MLQDKLKKNVARITGPLTITKTEAEKNFADLNMQTNKEKAFRC